MKLSLVAAGIGLSSLRGPWSWSWFKVGSWRARLRNDMGYQLLYCTSLAGTPQVELQLLPAPQQPPRRALTISGWLDSTNKHHLPLAFSS